MQTVISINGEKIEVTAKRSPGNIVEYVVNVNEKRYKFTTLYIQEAMYRGFAKYVKEKT